MKNKRKQFTFSIIVLLLIYTLCSLFSDTDEVIGIVLTVKGDFVQERGGSVTSLLPGDKVYNDSIIKLEKGTARGKVQIGSAVGPVIYTRFPVKFSTSTLASLTSAQQDNLTSCIGGTVLKSRSVTLFDWFMKSLGALDEQDIKNGFSVVFSKNKDSSENLVLDPLYFKLKDDVRIKSITGKLINKDENNRVELDSIKIKKRIKDWSIALDQFSYDYAVEYAVKTTVTYMDNKTENFEFLFYIYGEDEIEYIEAEAQDMFLENETDYGKAIIRAGRYRNYEMHLKGMEILKEAGIDIDGML